MKPNIYNQFSSIKRNKVFQLPKTIATLSGKIINTSSNKWEIPVSTFTSIISFDSGAVSPLENELKHYAVERLTSVSESVSNFTLSVWTKHFNKFLKSQNKEKLYWNDFTLSILESYLLFLRSKGIGYYFWHIQTVFRWLKLNYLEILTPETINVIDEATSWTIEGNTKGEAVALNNPYEGALTILESDSIRQKALDSNSNSNLLEKVVVLLFLETGQRNEQLCKLLISDLKKVSFRPISHTNTTQIEPPARYLSKLKICYFRTTAQQS